MTETLTLSEQEILDQIQAEVAANKVFLYMKGTPEQPRCGFSNQVVQILNHLGVEYGARDILVDPRIRQVLSAWHDAWEAAQKPGGKPLPSLHSSEYAPDPDPTIDAGVKAMTASALELLK